MELMRQEDLRGQQFLWMHSRRGKVAKRGKLQKKRDKKKQEGGCVGGRQGKRAQMRMAHSSSS